MTELKCKCGVCFPCSANGKVKMAAHLRKFASFLNTALASGLVRYGDVGESDFGLGIRFSHPTSPTNEGIVLQEDTIPSAILSQQLDVGPAFAEAGIRVVSIPELGCLVVCDTCQCVIPSSDTGIRNHLGKKGHDNVSSIPVLEGLDNVRFADLADVHGSEIASPIGGVTVVSMAVSPDGLFYTANQRIAQEVRGVPLQVRSCQFLCKEQGRTVWVILEENPAVEEVACNVSMDSARQFILSMSASNKVTLEESDFYSALERRHGGPSVLVKQELTSAQRIALFEIAQDGSKGGLCSSLVDLLYCKVPGLLKIFPLAKALNMARYCPDEITANFCLHGSYRPGILSFLNVLISMASNFDGVRNIVHADVGMEDECFALSQAQNFEQLVHGLYQLFKARDPVFAPVTSKFPWLVAAVCFSRDNASFVSIGTFRKAMLAARTLVRALVCYYICASEGQFQSVQDMGLEQYVSEQFPTCFSCWNVWSTTCAEHEKLQQRDPKVEFLQGNALPPMAIQVGMETYSPSLITRFRDNLQTHMEQQLVEVLGDDFHELLNPPLDLSIFDGFQNLRLGESVFSVWLEQEDILPKVLMSSKRVGIRLL